MKYTREHGVVRILIGCLNHTKIPRTFPMFIKDGLYMLSFHVEGEEQRAIKDVIMAEPRDNDEDDDPEDEDLGDDFRDLDKENSSSKSGGKEANGSKQMDPSPSQQSGGTTTTTQGNLAQTGVVFSPLVRRTFGQAMAMVGSPIVRRVIHDDSSVLDSVVQLLDIEKVKESAT